MKVYPIDARPSTDDYPYGRLRATATFGVEFKKNKGFRSFFQTVNPKTGRVNAPKNGTYNTFMCVILNEETGHFEYQGFNIRGYKDINRVSKFIADNLEALSLTEEQTLEICANMFNVIRISVAYTSVEKRDKVKEVLIPVLETIKLGLKGDREVFSKINIDLTLVE